MTYSAQSLAEHLFGELGLSKNGCFYVAYSGGVDSTVLLHMLRAVKELPNNTISVTALHVNHGLQPQADQWAQHCESISKQLGVPFIHTKLALQTKSELEARNARYQWFTQQIKAGSVLMTAHHEQDRAETLLFNLMRGSGSAGLSSLRAVRPFFGSSLVRPLLHLSKQEITQYAQAHNLRWVEDPSNQLHDYSRNEIRHAVLPALNQFRADAVRNIARAASNLEQENSLMREIAIGDLVEVREYPRHPLDNSHALCFDDIPHLSKARQANLLRFWLASLQLHTPSKRLLDRLLEAFENPPASTAVLQESGTQFRFYRGYMYVMPSQEQAQATPVIEWQNINSPIDLYQTKIRVDATRKLRELLSSQSLNDLRHGGLRLATKPQLQNPKALQGHSLNLKKWLQDIGIPPWRRQTLPLLTMPKVDSDIVLGPVDQQFQSDWVQLHCPAA